MFLVGVLTSMWKGSRHADLKTMSMIICRALPAELANLANLSELDVSLNNLSQLPDVWLSSDPGLSSSLLTYAALNGNQFTVRLSRCHRHCAASPAGTAQDKVLSS